MITDRYMEPTDLSGYNEAPIDLSRVCDSVETRTTPSPYNSSGCEENSPYRLNESPISLTSSQQSSRNYSTEHTQSCNDSASLTHYQSHPFQQQHYSLSHGHESTGFTHKKHRLSLPTQPNLHHSLCKRSINNIDDEINSNIQHAVALQQNMQTSSVATVLKNDKLPSNEYTVMMGHDGKLERPFKAYEKESSVIDFNSDRFNIFRQQMLKEMNLSGFPISNPNMRRTPNKSEHQNMDTEMELQADCISDASSSNGPSNTKSEMVKDLAYYERRKKNNEAAKKSRDRRKMKEDEIAIRIAFLEQENFQLKIELAAAKRQVELFLRK